MVMVTIAERKLVTAGKDISNPGSIGTLGMLCETSKVGACVDIAKIPKPENMDMEQWLKIYPATGYVVTAKHENVQECLQTFSQAGITAAAVGEITDSQQVEIHDQKEKATVFDLTKDIITGIDE